MKTTHYSIAFVLCITLLAIPGRLAAQRIATGASHSLGMCYDSSARAWGYNAFGQLGDGSTGSNSSTPVQVASVSQAISIVSGTRTSLILRKDSTVWAFGYNTDGEVGDGTSTDRFSPVQVHGPGNVGYLTGVKAVAGGNGYGHSLALKHDGTVWGWGFNNYGGLGDSTTTGSLTPVQTHGPGSIPFLTNIVSIAAGGDYSLALRDDSTVWGWGYNNYGQLGMGSSTNRLNPVAVYGMSNVKLIGAGLNHSFAVKYDGTLWAWGQNDYGKLGDSTTTNRSIPVQIPGLNNVIMIDGGQHFAIALKSDGTVWTWGNNMKGQLGDGTIDDHWMPKMVDSLSGIIEISAGQMFAMALKNDGTIWAWGDNSNGQLGDGTTINRWRPVQVNGMCQTTNTGLSAVAGRLTSTAYPNPFSKETTIRTTRPLINATLEVFNQMGQLVKLLSDQNGQTIVLKRDNLPAGIYFIRTMEGNETIATSRVVVAD